MDISKVVVINCLLLLMGCVACRHSGGKYPSASDSLAHAGGDSSQGPRQVFLRERAHAELPAYSVSFIAEYWIPARAVLAGRDSGGYFTANYCRVKDKKTGETDSVKLEAGDLSGCPACMVFVYDRTDSLSVKPLLVQIVTPAEDILFNNEFIGYRNGKLEELFLLEDAKEAGVMLVRHGDSGIAGNIANRDDVVDAWENSYPVFIDEGFGVHYPLPDAQYIGFETTAAEGFRGHRVVNGLVTEELVEVKAGKTVFVDSFYRPLGKVRLLVGDSVAVEIKKETAQKKLRHLIAG